MDYYEINHRWQELPIVLEGHEIRTVYAPSLFPPAQPFNDAKELAAKLRGLAQIEHALALEYLYARYSVRTDLTGEAKEHATFLADELLLIAASEMMHLRWANQILWELWHAGLIPADASGPVLSVAEEVPQGPSKMRGVKMRSLNEGIDDFIAAESPSGTIGGQYARVHSTLHLGREYPPALGELASRIIADGASHFTRFCEIRAVLFHYSDPVKVDAYRRGEAFPSNGLVRSLGLAKIGDARIRPIKAHYLEIVKGLKQAYNLGAAGDRDAIADARKAMSKLDNAAKALASNPRRPTGAPLDKIGNIVAADVGAS
jgi:hypothetical protein